MRPFARTVGIAMFTLCALTSSNITPVRADSANVDITAVVAGDPPASPPVIDVPFPNMTFSEKNIEVNGTCIDGLVVKVFRNAIFAGSALCQPDNTFSMHIDLVEGRNDLNARQYDFLSQPSPDSDTITIYYVPASLQPVNPDVTSPPASETAGFQLVIDYDYNFQGVFVNEDFGLPIHFIGGTGPYAVSIAWGDGDSDVSSREDTSQFYVYHTYTKAGPYIIEIRVSDSAGQTAYLQFVLLVNGGSTAVVSGGTNSGRGDDPQAPGKDSSVATVVTTAAISSGISFTTGFALAAFWDKVPTAWNKLRLKIRGPKIPSK